MTKAIARAPGPCGAACDRIRSSTSVQRRAAASHFD